MYIYIYTFVLCALSPDLRRSCPRSRSPRSWARCQRVLPALMMMMSELRLGSSLWQIEGSIFGQRVPQPKGHRIHPASHLPENGGGCGTNWSLPHFVLKFRVCSSSERARWAEPGMLLRPVQGQVALNMHLPGCELECFSALMPSWASALSSALAGCFSACSFLRAGLMG